MSSVAPNQILFCHKQQFGFGKIDLSTIILILILLSFLFART